MVARVLAHDEVVSFPTLSFDTHELESRAPAPATVDEAVRLFTQHGALRLHNVFAPDFLASLRAHYLERYRFELGGTSKADLRPLYTVDITGPVADPWYFSNPLLTPIIARVLGPDFVIGACSTVISFPGAPQQFVHRDSQWLFDNLSVDVQLPVHALTVLMPMVDANAQTGSTRVWPGTHREPDFEKAQQVASDSPDVPFGSVLMTDSRVVHCGSPNVSQRVRPLLYNSYHRSWFRDWGGYETRPPVHIGAIERRRLPERYAHMFRVADESSGSPEGPSSVRAWLKRALGGARRDLS